MLFRMHLKCLRLFNNYDDDKIPNLASADCSEYQQYICQRGENIYYISALSLVVTRYSVNR